MSATLLTTTRARIRLRYWALPVVLHAALCLGLYQSGFDRDELSQLRIEGRSHLSALYVKAFQQHGPFGPVRAYFRGQSDERLYLEYAKLLLRGRADRDYIAERQQDVRELAPLPARAWPYRDVRVEYPPLAFVALAPPALLSTEYPDYRCSFISYMLLLHFLNLWLAWRLLHPHVEASQSAARSTGRLLYASFAFCAALGSLVVTRMDHIAVTWTLLCLLAFARTQTSQARKRLVWAAACGGIAALGVMTKVVPGLAALAACALWLRSDATDRYRCVVACCLGCALTLLLINAPLLLLAGAPYLETFSYHGQRGVQLESTYAGLLMLLRPLGMPLGVADSFGSTNVVTCATQLIKVTSACLFVLAAGYVLLFRRFANNPLGATLLTCVLLLVFMLTNRVFSPQYLIWIAAPVLVLATHQPAERRLWWTCFAAVVLSQLIFPRGYPLLKAFHPLAVVLLNLRNGLLVLVTLQLLRQYSRPALPAVR